MRLAGSESAGGVEGHAGTLLRSGHLEKPSCDASVASGDGMPAISPIAAGIKPGPALSLPTPEEIHEDGQSKGKDDRNGASSESRGSDIRPVGEPRADQADVSAPRAGGLTDSPISVDPSLYTDDVPGPATHAGEPGAVLEALEVSYRGELVRVVRSRRFSVDDDNGVPIWRARHKGRIGSGITPEDAAREVCR